MLWVHYLKMIVAIHQLHFLPWLRYADTYISGDYAGEAYLDKELFRKEGINLIFQNWACPEYSQLFPEAGFISDLSIIDLIFNEGENSIKILKRL